MGEISNITVRDITANYSRTAIIANSMLRDIKLYNINGSGECRSLVSIGPDYWEQEKKTGVTIENMLLDGAHLQKDKKGGTILDFSILPEGAQFRTVKEEESEWFDKANHYALPTEAR